MTFSTFLKGFLSQSRHACYFCCLEKFVDDYWGLEISLFPYYFSQTSKGYFKDSCQSCRGLSVQPLWVSQGRCFWSPQDGVCFVVALRLDSCNIFQVRISVKFLVRDESWKAEWVTIGSTDVWEQLGCWTGLADRDLIPKKRFQVGSPVQLIK